MSAVCENNTQLQIKDNNNSYKKHFMQFNQQDEVEMKYKTCLCKNFTSYGKCKYKNECHFAHGEKELLHANQINDLYLTKPCVSYYDQQGECRYGANCKFMHSNLKKSIQWWGFLKKLYKKLDIPYTFPWDKGEYRKKGDLFILRFQRLRYLHFQIGDILILEPNNTEIVSSNKRLPFFENICNNEIVNQFQI